jgi:hypothetical protein
MHKVDGYNVKYTSRGAWTVELSKPGKQPIIAPVTCQSDYDFHSRKLKVWFKNPKDSETYRTRMDPFLVALIVPKKNDDRAFGQFTRVFTVQATGNLVGDVPGYGIETTVIG